MNLKKTATIHTVFGGFSFFLGVFCFQKICIPLLGRIKIGGTALEEKTQIARLHITDSHTRSTYGEREPRVITI